MSYELDIKLSAFEELPRNFRCVKCDCSEPALMITTENVVLGICEDCLQEFIEQDCKAILEEVYKTCWYCKHFVHDDGRHYAGKCPFKKYDCWHYEHCDKFEKKE